MWSFKVNSDCSVNYLGYTDWGFYGISQLPDPINCNLFASISRSDLQSDHYMIYPNPASDLVTVKVSDNTFGSDYYSIIDATGRQILSGKLEEEITLINISEIPVGIYLLQIGQHKKQVFKLIKK